MLYVVERITLLSTAFMLASLVLYLQLRLRFRESWSSPMFLAGLLCSGLLAVTGLFAKENAASLLFYLLALEFTLLATVPGNAFIMRARKLLWLPVAVLLALLLWRLDTVMSGYELLFDHGPGQRLMTQARIGWYQLFHSLLPSSDSSALFIDFPVARSLFPPLLTLPAVAAWLVVIALAGLYRNRYPVLAFALFWFLAGHVIESTVLPLEMFFQHRNYLALFGPVFALVLALERGLPSLRDRIDARVLRLLPAALVAVSALQLGLLARLWHEPLALSYRWVSAHPQQERNQQFFASQLASAGQVDQALTLQAEYIAR